MNKVLIVDDETIVRVTLKSLVNWEQYGFEIVEDFINGRQALDYLRKNTADLMLMDMRMPEMDGLELLENLNREGNFPVTIALSGYNEFELVREAFRLGAYDYMLKSDLTKEKFEELLTRLNTNIFKKVQSKKTDGMPINRILEDYKSLEGNEYGAVIFQIDHFRKQAARFAGDEETLKKSILELARQITRVASHARIQAVSASRYVMFYRAECTENYQKSILSAVKQLQSVWHDYMNLTLSAAVSNLVPKEQLKESLTNNEKLLRLIPIAGDEAVCLQWEQKAQLWTLSTATKKYSKLIAALYAVDNREFEVEKEKLFQLLGTLTKEEAVRESVAVLTLLAEKFEDFDDDFQELFLHNENYFEKLNRLENIREFRLWLNNYFNWVLDYIGNRQDNSRANMILRARRFMVENYKNPELTLKSVSDYVGLNEKYFTTRFTKETGTTFSNYLTNLRLQKARELINTTNLRIYEISDRVGYNSVEHFNRTFKKVFGMSPSDCKKQSGKI